MTAKTLLTQNTMSFRKTLLHWYQTNKRNLPWRKTKDPYAILVSEIMLQQTQVNTVIPYFLKFMAKFPHIKALAAADEASVLKLWQGLGYYRRARFLKHAAQQIIEIFDGDFPREKAAIDRLKGVGSYTSAAVSSIAFGLPHACVDGNVIRVITRIAALDSDVGHASSLKAISMLAQYLLDPDDPGDYNQAMMELGATVCTPRKPSCLACPIDPFCQTKAQGDDPHLRPLKTKKTKVKKHQIEMGFFFYGNRFLLARRPPSGLMANMWEFPAQDADLSKPWQQFFQGHLKQIWRRPKPFLHKFTHRHVQYAIGVWSLAHPQVGISTLGPYTAFEMLTLEDLAGRPLTHVCQKLLPELQPFLELHN